MSFNHIIFKALYFIPKHYPSRAEPNKRCNNSTYYTQAPHGCFSVASGNKEKCSYRASSVLVAERRDKSSPGCPSSWQCSPKENCILPRDLAYYFWVTCVCGSDSLKWITYWVMHSCRPEGEGQWRPIRIVDFIKGRLRASLLKCAQYPLYSIVWLPAKGGQRHL